MANSLDFEQPIVDLEAKIEELRRVESAGELDLQNDHKRAVQTLRQALAVKPDDIETLNTLGNAEQACGRLATALSCYEQAASLILD